jgi:hypothetical protein
MSPHTTELKVADLCTTSHTKCIDELTLLLDWEKDIALDPKYQNGYQFEWLKASSKLGKVGCVMQWGRMRFG